MVFDDGVTARLGRAPLPHDHDHRRRGARAGVARGVAADRVAAISRSTAPRSPSTGRPSPSPGPKAREVLRAAGTDLDSRRRRASRIMAFAEGTVAGIPARVFRISFSGELAYEINVPWRLRRRAVGGAVRGGRSRTASRPTAPRRMHVLRAEKGYIIVGQDTDGTVTPVRPRHGLDRQQDEAGLHRQARARARRHCGARTASSSSACSREDPARCCEEGAQIVADARAGRPPVPMIGHVTSSYCSPTSAARSRWR